MQKNDTQNIKALGIIGSPRRGGNTESFVEEVLSGVKETGAQVETYFLSQLNIKPCNACDVCKKTGKCIHPDDMLKLLDKIKCSRVIVLGTPLYFWGSTAQFKAFIDRFYGAKQALKEKKVIIVIPFEDAEVKAARYLSGMLEETMRFLNANIVNIILLPRTLNPDDIYNYPDVLESARKAGREAIKELTL